MTDDPTAAPTRPTREQATQALLDATEAISAYINAGGADGCLDSANVIGIWSTDGRQARITQGDFRRIAEVRAALLAGEGTAQPDPPVTVTYTNWQGETAERHIIPVGLWWGVTEWHPRSGWLLDAWDVDRQALRSFSLNGFDLAKVVPLRFCRASGDGTAPQPDHADLLAAAADWLDSLPRLYPDQPNGWAGEYSIDPSLVQNLAHALRGTAPQVPAEVLWEGETHDHGAVNLNVSSIMDQYGADPVLPVPPGTRVRVVAADGAPQEGDERG